MNRIAALAAAISLAGLASAYAPSAYAADPAPQVREPLTEVPQAPFNESADAHADVALALSRAAATHKYVLLDFGGNWCPDCRVTSGVLQMKEVQPWIARNFIVVPIDVGRMNRNLDIAETYGQKIHAVPTMVVLDATGKILNAGNPTALSDARSMTPQAIVDTLNGWIQNPG
jgi:thiol-disulfide isomerase/thioredoxin